MINVPDIEIQLSTKQHIHVDIYCNLTEILIFLFYEVFYFNFASLMIFALTLDGFYRYIAGYKLFKIKSKFFLIVNMYCQIMQNRLIKVLYFQCVHLTCTNKNAI